MPDISKESTALKLQGAHNIIFIVTIVIAVVLSGTLTNVPAFIGANGELKGLHIGEVTFSFVTVIEIAIILLSALLSFKTTPSEIRTKNHFNWGAIQEVAVLFIGIFITMQPALMILGLLVQHLELTRHGRCSGQQVHFQVSLIIHQHTLYSLQLLVH